MRSLYIESAHAALEHDQSYMFAVVMGYAVAGEFDIGSKQRPKLQHITDKNLPKQEGLEHADIYLMHQVPEFDVQFNAYCQRRKKPVVLHYFGQGCERMHRNVAVILNQYPNAYVSAYSRTDYQRLIDFGANPEKVRMIRFGKELAHYGTWNGNLPVAYLSGNSFHRRGVGCGFVQFQELIKCKTPILVSGKDTDELPYGLGELSYAALLNMYRTCRCYVSMGTTPAPYVLTLSEALCMGMPVVAYNNGAGIAYEDLGVKVCNSVVDMYHEIIRLIDEKEYANRQSKIMIEKSKQFDIRYVGKQWDDFINTMVTA